VVKKRAQGSEQQ